MSEIRSLAIGLFRHDGALLGVLENRRPELALSDESTSARPRLARWYPIESLAAGDPPLYPRGLVELITGASRA